ncbi:sulfatase-like hydrolase/transferase [Paenibacillus filicis]|uniref:Sulfatase-like hydrolase/transferase n=1 Tax=Paenibacillus gyeongsangnamensis TaxID=3388067 RepID=A0ABT4QBA5_9BACL|nr:sulfatase-like hydrolase/transferase [Paenibacillus filicis]MCZ8514173.1 sulfatase-like hydrolase/transferase [Paenibacillus filicis]
MPPWTRRWTGVLGLLLCLTVPSSEFIKPLSLPPLPDLTVQNEWSKDELQKPPNIIIVLSEAFWDITQIKSLKFSRDPIPFFHSLQKKTTHGTLLSPMFGGGTANVELEVLTGLSMRFFPEDSIPYEDYIKQPTESLASLLKAQGYHTTAISPFYHWYFNSSEVYKDLGFSRFISLEYFNPDEYVGPYIGDHAVAKRIIEESRRSPGPDFIFANTMENHYHYWPGKFKRNTIDITGDAPGDALGIAETYAQGSQGADRMLQELVTYYNDLREPTILVWFGDHLPSLEKNYVYEQTKYISGENDPDFLEKMHNTPVLIWSNYLPPAADKELHLSPSFLGPLILQTAGRTGSAYTDYLAELYKKLPIVPPADRYQAMGIDPALVKEYEARQQAQWEAQKLHSQTPANGEPDNPFVLGYGAPALEGVSPESVPVGGDSFGRTQLTLRGGRFGLGATVFINGSPVPSTWQSEQTLTVNLPKEHAAKPGTLNVQVKVIDSKNNVLGTSNTVSVPVTEKKQ